MLSLSYANLLCPTPASTVTKFADILQSPSKSYVLHSVVWQPLIYSKPSNEYTQWVMGFGATTGGGGVVYTSYKSNKYLLN